MRRLLGNQLGTSLFRQVRYLHTNFNVCSLFSYSSTKMVQPQFLGQHKQGDFILITEDNFCNAWTMLKCIAHCSWDVLMLLGSVQHHFLCFCHFNWDMGGIVLIWKHDSQHDSINITTGAGTEITAYTLTHLNATEDHHHLQIAWQPGSVASFQKHRNISVSMGGFCQYHATWYSQPQSGRWLFW